MKRLTKTKIYLDGGDPQETQAANQLLAEADYAQLDGQTTNPSLVAKNPDIARQIKLGKKLTSQQLLAHYQRIIRAIDALAPGDISVEVYADADTTAAEMIAQARQFQRWSSSIVIKIPINEAGLEAAGTLCREMRLNLTLCFTQAQAAAVHQATRHCRYQVYVSPFIGRLDDRGLNGMDLIANIQKMYEDGDGHVHIITASIRSVDHILGALKAKSHVITVPFESAFKPWAADNFPLPDKNYQYSFAGAPIPFEKFDLNADWRATDIKHELTDQGLKKFADDWNSLLSLEHVKKLA